MADTIYTKDGKIHTVFSDKDKIDLIREYAGDDLAFKFEKAINNKIYEETRVQTDCDTYESTIEEYRGMILEACETMKTVSKSLYFAQRLGPKFKDEQVRILETLANNILANI